MVDSDADTAVDYRFEIGEDESGGVYVSRYGSRRVAR